MYLPSALMYGVPWDVFWKLNPKKLKIFERNYEKGIEIQQARMNLNAWLNGLYVQNAVASVFSKSARYPKKPFDMFKPLKPKTAEEEGADFLRYVMQYNAEHRNKSVNRKG